MEFFINTGQSKRYAIGYLIKGFEKMLGGFYYSINMIEPISCKKINLSKNWIDINY